ncbi:hypothetical protein FZEAL_8618 [Fusarium zealandicum]|uniref:Uncharacterized protein n=1 Tax=Fusarium zealandicum TaxID=1053134 RepID=A0A8H4UDV9_9HYPO|nr:hypothetical protein FZEAL_8618 [Fusarium zealandicum]
MAPFTPLQPRDVPASETFLSFAYCLQVSILCISLFCFIAATVFLASNRRYFQKELERAQRPPKYAKFTPEEWGNSLRIATRLHLDEREGRERQERLAKEADDRNERLKAELTDLQAVEKECRFFKQKCAAYDSWHAKYSNEYSDFHEYQQHRIEEQMLLEEQRFQQQQEQRTPTPSPPSSVVYRPLGQNLDHDHQGLGPFCESPECITTSSGDSSILEQEGPYGALQPQFQGDDDDMSLHPVAENSSYPLGSEEERLGFQIADVSLTTPRPITPPPPRSPWDPVSTRPAGEGQNDGESSQQGYQR